MDIMEGIYTRRSIRKYTEKEVPKEDVKKLIEAAIMAPSASNTQTWSFAVIQNRENLKRYSETAKGMMLQILEGKPDPHGYREILSNPDFDIFYGAGTLVVIYSTAGGTQTAINCSMAAENLMLAAHAQGLGTCWIGFSVAYLNSAEFKKEHGIPETYTAIAPIVAGYPGFRPSSYARKEPQILVWE